MSKGNNETVHEDTGTEQGEQTGKDDGIENGGGRGGRAGSDDGRRDTFEVDLDEVRWTEWTGNDRRKSESQANKLAGIHPTFMPMALHEFTV